MRRSKASGRSQSDQTVAATVTMDAAMRIPLAEIPAVESAQAASDPANTPEKMKTFDSAMTAPRRSSDGRDCSMAANGTMSSLLEIPTNNMIASVHV